MSEPTLRRLSELALIGIASIWGLTFVMVKDAIRELQTMAFLAYRFLPAALIVGLIFHKQLRALPREGWRAGLVMGLFLTGGYVFQTLGLEETTASNTGFITGLFVVLTPVLGAVFLGQSIPTRAWVAAGVAMFGLWLLSGAGDQFDVVGLVSLAIAAATGQLEPPEGSTVWSALIVTSLVASALGFFVQSFAQKHSPPARTALILASEPAFAGLFGWLLNDERLTVIGWLGAALIMAAIVAVEIVPRLRPPRPLPEE